tara:strand:+ start:6314 stop:7576 length:1263 start_codon:yes stop_codon:yes gene_type:complete
MNNILRTSDLLSQPRIYLYQNYFLYVIALLLPVFPKLLPFFIVLFGLLSIVNIIKGYNKAELGEVSILLIILYVLHVFGMFTTENVDRGLFDLEVKLSLLAIPLSFIGFRFLTTTAFNNILKLFMLGTISNGLICLVYATYNYFFSDLLPGRHAYYFFFSGYFSTLVHPNYFALYANFSLVILSYLEWPIFVKGSWQNRIRSAVIAVFFTALVVFSGSKIGLIMWLVIAFGITVLLLREVRHKWVPIITMVLLLSLVVGFIQSAPTARERFFSLVRVAQRDALDKKADDSTSARLLVYKAGLNLVINQDWIGQGTGDFQDALDAEYERLGYEYPLSKHLNAHNLFVQTWIALGVPGFLMIIGLFTLMFSLAFKVRDNLFLGFSGVFLIISLTESTFNVQTGVVFFAFFAVLFSRRLKVSV